MKKIRVLVVDDSVVIRRLLTDILGQEPDIEIAGTASNGRLALAKLSQINPDLVTLDIEMPDMDGLATLPELRKAYPKLPVIMFSTLTSRGAMETLDALALGATDYVTKPANVGSVSAGMQCVRDQLVPKIKALCPISKPVAPALNLVGPPRKLMAAGRRKTAIDIVAIGSSTGGPQALTTVLRALPKNIGVPIVITQHMPPVFTKHLADRLNAETGFAVKEAKTGDVLAPGHVFIAPGDYHLELRREGVAIKTWLTQAPPENSCRPAVDVMFRSVANLYGANSLAVVLTGMGQDGLRGGQEIVHVGGTLIAQDEPSCVVWGMPRAVTEAGLASRVAPLTSIANEIQNLVAASRPQLLPC